MRRLCDLAARAAAVIRIDAVWLAVEPVEPIDLRAGAERLLAGVVQVFGAAQAHHGYLFCNTRSTRIKRGACHSQARWRSLGAGSAPSGADAQRRGAAVHRSAM